MARPPLLEYLEAVSIALGRGLLTPPQASVAVLLGIWGSNGLSGERVTIDAARLAAELGVSERTVWRHVSALTAGGWLEQTEAPTRGAKGQKGRRARYRLTASGLSVALENQMTRLAEELAHDDPNRLTDQAQSSDTAEPETGAVLPTDGYPLLPHPSAVPTGQARDDAGEWMESTA